MPVHGTICAAQRAAREWAKKARVFAAAVARHVSACKRGLRVYGTEPTAKGGRDQEPKKGAGVRMAEMTMRNPYRVYDPSAQAGRPIGCHCALRAATRLSSCGRIVLRLCPGVRCACAKAKQTWPTAHVGVRVQGLRFRVWVLVCVRCTSKHAMDLSPLLC